MNSIEKIEEFAKENYVPIARKETLEYIKKIFKENKQKSVLERGTPIGYTCINVAVIDPSISILTLEYEEKRFNIAKENIKDFKVENQIQQVYGDARFFYPDLYYDVIFIDAAKKRNKYFLDKFSKRLNNFGTIIIDNMNLDDLWVDAKKEKKEEYDLVNKEFKEYILTLKDYEVNIYDDIGDGIAVLKRKYQGETNTFYFRLQNNS